MDDELEGLLDAAEDAVAETVAEVLQEVADEFARSLEDATEIVAARFSVSRIGRMFADRMPRVVRRLLGVSEQAAQQGADAVDAELPDGWDDLPARYDDDTLPPAMSEYVEVTEHLLRAVGERLAEAARQELAAGVDAGEDVEQLRARLRDRFAREGTQLGASREQLIARTESARAWNTATLEAARALSGPDRPLVKQWQTRRDTQVRDAHEDVDGQLRFLDEPFTVGGVAMQAPGDPTAPPELVCNCRCILRLERAPEPTASVHDRLKEPFRSRFPDLDDAVADAMVAWNNPFYGRPLAVESQVPSAAASEIPRELLDDLAARVLRPALEAAGVPNADSYSLAWDDRPIPVTAERSAMPGTATAAADGVQHTGAMIALIPTEEDAERLALDGGEPADELHLTLFYLGEGADWNEDQRQDLIANMRTIAARHGQFTAQAFGVNYWNPGSDTPAWVWAIGDDRDAPDDAPTLHEFHNGAVDALEDMHGQPELPIQHSPWVPHMCGAYTSETWPLDEMADRVGPITFDRVRLAFAGEHTDIQLGTPQEEAMPDSTAAGEPTVVAFESPPTVRTWSTPGDTAVAYEDEETGDGRIFAPGALYWETGPYPLQYADEMLMGHQGAELAGAMNEVGRDGKRITSSGVLYATREAGLDAITLLEEEAPLGISVDLDDVDLEFVDRTIDPEDAEWMFARASVSAASVMRLQDGAYMLSVSTGTNWATADGGTMSRRRYDIQLVTDTDGQLSAAGIRDAFAGTGALTAAAGDADDPEAVVLWSEKAGDFLVRITRARLRGATLVAMPAYSQARIVLDPLDEDDDRQAAAGPIVAASGDTTARVVTYVRSSPAAVGAREVSRALGIGMSTARTHLHKAAKDELIVRLAPGLFCGKSSMPEGLQDLQAALPGQLDVPADLERLMASTYSTAGDGKPMPAAWFAEPTEAELPPGSGGVHYADGRIFGWVAQAGEPHAGFPGRNLTIESLGKLDLTHFLRARFKLDNGSFIKAGAFTMNVGHHRDGAECETSSCQFDDTRTVAGVVTVGMNKRGLWFSGAAAPWLSEWDRTVFQACQPSYHMRQGPGGKWQLRAVLSVPVPGHSSPLLATAMVERSNLALAASAAALTAPDTTEERPDTLSGQSDTGVPAGPDTGSGLHGQSPDNVSGQPSAAGVDELIAALLDGPFIDQLTAELERRDAERRAEIEALTAAIAPTPEEITASAALKGAR